MQEKVYHYTSTSTFMNIFNTNQLWMGGLNETNDINEMFLVKENFKKVVFKHKDEIIPHYSEKTKEQILEENFGIFNSFLYNCDVPRLYFISFTENIDDLFMWNMYGDNAKGINIEFDKKDLTEFAKKEKFKFFSIIYINEEASEKIQEKLSNKMISIINEQVKRQNTAYKKRRVHLGATEEMYNDFIDIIEIASKYKKECFSSEKESRLIYKTSDAYSEYGASFNLKEMTKIKASYLDKQERIKLFLPIDLTNFHKLYPFFEGPQRRQLVNIMCGSRNNTPKSIFYFFLTQKGYTCKCQSSSIPLRK